MRYRSMRELVYSRELVWYLMITKISCFFLLLVSLADALCFFVFKTTGGTSEAAELGLANVGGVFIVLVTGVIGSTLTAMIEMSFGALSRSMKYKIPLKEELKNEFKFLLRCKGLTKPVRTSSEEVDNEEELDANSDKLNDMVEEMNERGNDFSNYNNGRNLGFDFSSPDILSSKNGRNNSIKQ